MDYPFARLSFATAALLLVVVLAPREAAASTVLTGGNLGNQTWTPAGSPYIVGGDITVQAGATLTIQAGTDVQFLTGDMQASGVDISTTELTVNGTLNIAGTTANPVTFEMQSGQAGNWYGIVVGAGAAGATVTGASFHGFYAAAIGSAMTGATLSVTRTTIEGTGTNTAGILVRAGSATLDQLTITAGGGGAMGFGMDLANTGSAVTQINLTNSLIVGCTYGVVVGAGNITGNLSNLTIDRGSYGINVQGPSPMVTVRNTIVTNVGTAGITATTGTTTVSYSDIWNAPTTLQGVTPGAGQISTNPQYVGATNYHLQASSVCIDTGTATGAPDHDLDGTSRPLDGDGINGAAYDMGAYEYNAGGGAGGAGGASATGTGGVAGTAGASGSGGAAGKGGTGAAGSGGASGAAGAGGTGGIAGTSGSAGAGEAGGGGSGAGGIGGAVSGGSGGSATGTGGIGGAAGMGSAGRTATGGSNSGLGGAAGGSTETGGSSASSGGGCGCQTGGRPGSTWGLALVAAAFLVRRRRRGSRV